MEKIRHKRDLFIAFLIGFAVAAMLWTMFLMMAGTALHIAQNHDH